ncbi:MAG: TAXI family TRAP transporter solute-binding subunit [Desulfomonile tiedjei]|nr:TAXI family TRAP transporter solute-binding subunit [Desulfomonile tiedjei]
MRKLIEWTLVFLVCLAFPLSVGAAPGNVSKEKPWKPGESIELIMASGGTGGTYYPLAGGIAKLWKDAIPGANVTVQATGASVANVRLLGKNEVDFALIQNDIAEYGRTGTESFADKKEKYTNYVAIGALYPEAVQIVVRSNSPIRGIEDLKGKTVVVGAAASGTELASRQILNAYGLTYGEKKDIKPLFLGFAEGATALRENSADALVIVAGIPNAALADVQTVTPIRLLPIDVNKLRKEHPFYVEFPVPAGTYKGLDSDVAVVALKAMLVVRDEINSQLVYEMTKALFEKAGSIGHAKAKEFDAKLAAQGVTIPFHPGAAQYFKEKGIETKLP